MKPAHYESTAIYNELGQTYDGIMMAVRAKVTRNGQVSLPAELRHRWGSDSVLVVDRGDYAIVRPIPEDAVATLKGAHTGPGPTSEIARAAERKADTASDTRRRTQ